MAAADVRKAVMPRLGTLVRYVHTVQYLRPIQIISRAWMGLHHPKPDLRPAPGHRPVSHLYQAPVEGVPALVAAKRFRFLNVEGACAAPGDWQPQGADKLWIYNLHYFDDLSARDAAARRAWHQQLLERWVDENPPGESVAWEPFPLSRRIVNWVKWSVRGGELSAKCRTSLAVQARWLRGRLEYHLLGNHLLANAKALVHAGLYFAGPEAERWYTHGMSLMERELREQVLSDGGHFERSPMYHALVLEDLLDVINLLRAYARTPPQNWFAVLAAMRRWLKVMTHPDGDIGFFNDAAFQVAPSSAALEAFADRLHLDTVPDPDEAVVALEPSGYVRARLGAAYLLCDCAPVGPDHQPGHAHADTLSFELSLAGQRVFVNSGVSEYGNHPERHRQRGTAAHNTVIVNGQDSSEVWGGFRVARRARPYLREARLADAALIEACHDGYARLPGRNWHARRWSLLPHSLRIEDRLSGDFDRAEARFHLHPSIDARLSAARTVTLCFGGQELGAVVFEGAAAVEVDRGTWHPAFGVTAANSFIAARFRGASLISHIRWSQAP